MSFLHLGDKLGPSIYCASALYEGHRGFMSHGEFFFLLFLVYSFFFAKEKENVKLE